MSNEKLIIWVISVPPNFSGKKRARRLFGSLLFLLLFGRAINYQQSKSTPSIRAIEPFSICFMFVSPCNKQLFF